MPIDRVTVIASVLACFACGVAGMVGGCTGGAGTLPTEDDANASKHSDSPDGSFGAASSSGSPEQSVGGGSGGGRPDGGYSNFGPCNDGGVTCFERRGSGATGAVSMGCKTEDTCAGESFACGSPAHCNEQLCCADTSDGSIRARCQSDCAGAEAIRLCETDVDCGEGGSCTKYACSQWVVSSVKACTKPAGCN